MCIYICVYISVYIYMIICVYIYIYVCIYILYIYICVYIYAYIQSPICFCFKDLQLPDPLMTCPRSKMRSLAMFKTGNAFVMSYFERSQVGHMFFAQHFLHHVYQWMVDNYSCIVLCLFVVCCLLFVVCCLLFVVCCLLLLLLLLLLFHVVSKFTCIVLFSLCLFFLFLVSSLGWLSSLSVTVAGRLTRMRGPPVGSCNCCFIEQNCFIGNFMLILETYSCVFST